MVKIKTLGSIGALVGLAMLGAGQAQAQQSQNTIIRNLPFNFQEDDIGVIVDLVFDACNMSPITELANGPYRRVSNAPGPTRVMGLPVISQGDARLDLVVYSSGGQPKTGAIAVTASQIEQQIGINPGASLSAYITVQSGTTPVISVEDTTGAGGPTPFLPGMILDAGPNIGGVDAVLLVKNGTPKQAEIICDQNMYYIESGAIKYGFKNFVSQLSAINSLYMFWTLGPSGAGTPAAITAICNAFNANGNVPIRNINDPSLDQDPSDYGLGPAALREIGTVGVTPEALRVFGDPEQLPANHTSCGKGITSYCDPTEPTPAEGALSGNACNRNRGFSSPGEFRVHNVLEGNTGCLLRMGGYYMYQDPCIAR